jgi:hypothetical protein
MFVQSVRREARTLLAAPVRLPVETLMTDQIGLVVATPCFGGQVSTLYLSSILRLQRELRAMPDIALSFQIRDGDALITRARANLAGLFLDDPQATHLLFVDADIGFEPDQVMRLIACGADVCAGVYPIKRIDWNKAAGVIASGRPKTRSAVLDYVLEVEDPQRISAVNGFARVRYAGTGFLMIRRHVLEKMCLHYPSLRFDSEHSVADAGAAARSRFALFECLIDADTGAYLSEDFSFCKRWTDMGGEIWADLQSRLDHVGPAIFYGDVATQFLAASPTNEAVT